VSGGTTPLTHGWPATITIVGMSRHSVKPFSPAPTTRGTGRRDARPGVLARVSVGQGFPP
jgi:hypothetical protein